MKECFEQYFFEKGIEYFAALDYSDCRVTNMKIAQRDKITPRSVIIYLLPYYAGETVNLSRYAASFDYHLMIAEVNRGIKELLGKEYPGSIAVGYGDHSPIDERHAAIIASLGIAGDNGLLINEKYGSYVFIGDVVTDIDPLLLDVAKPAKVLRCESCGACRRACPTGILRGDGDACLSAITQRKGELLDSEISLMRKYNTVWGCDECQSACPHNRNPRITPIEFFHKDRIPRLTREILDSMDEDSFGKRAFAWRKRATVERNLKLVDYEK